MLHGICEVFITLLFNKVLNQSHLIQFHNFSGGGGGWGVAGYWMGDPFACCQKKKYSLLSVDILDFEVEM